jgi:hypothetical protein
MQLTLACLRIDDDEVRAVRRLQFRRAKRKATTLELVPA